MSARGLKATRGAVSLLLVASQFVAAGAQAEGKVSADTCFESFERTQEARKADLLVEARQAAQLCRHTDCPEEIRSACFEWEGELAADVPSIVIAVREADGTDATGYTVELDGVLREDGLSGTAITLDPGPHEVRFLGPSGREETRELVIAKGEQNRPVVLSLRAEPQGKDEASSRWTPVVITSGIVGLVGAGVATFATIRALNIKSTLETTCKPNCSDEQVSEVNPYLTTADVGLVVAAVGLTTAVGFFIWGAPSAEDAAATSSATAGMRFDVGPTEGGAFGSLRGSF